MGRGVQGFGGPRQAQATMAREEVTLPPEEEQLRRTRRMLSLAVLLGANLLPLLGVLFWGWRLFDLIVVYWLETLVIGVFAILKIALTSGAFALFAVPFFIVHFGGFMTGHLIFLTMMFGDKRAMNFSQVPRVTYDLIVNHGLWIALVGLCISHGVGFVIYFLVPWLRERWSNWKRGIENKPAETGALMFAPYGRVIVLHVTILFGGFLVGIFGSHLLVLALLITLKTASDVYVLGRSEK